MSTLIIYILISVVAIMLASLVGVLFAWKTLGDWLKPRLPLMIALAFGVFVVIVFNLVTEIFHEGFNINSILAFIFGGIFLHIMTCFLPKDSHHHHHGTCESAPETINARRVLVGDAIHNVHDGLTLVPAFLVSPVVGFGTAAAIFLHEIVQEISEFFILKGAGYSTKKALVYNFLVSATILIGAGLSLFLASFEELSIYLIAFSAGGFSYILVKDIAPSIISHAKKEKRYAPYVVSTIIGIVLMAIISFTVPKHVEIEELYPLPDGFGLASIEVPPVVA